MKPWVIGSKERGRLLSEGPNIMDAYSSVDVQYRIPSSNHKDIEKAIAIGRKFNNEVIRPMTLDLDLKLMQDHNYLPWDFVEKAAQWGLFSLFLPKMYGGGGLNFISLYPFAEEITSACAGLGHVIMGHYCGCGTMFASMNSRLLYKVFSDVCESEKTGKPHLLTLVVTEPSSGTDIQEPLLIHHAKTQSSIKRVEGGFVANGTKIFITNGLVSYWHLCHFWENKNNKAETWVQCLVSNDDKGFSFGSHEKKMGQDACSAAELVFEDCFIADDQITFRSQDPEFKNSKKGPKWVCHTVVDLVTQCTRTGTAAISTGMARNAFETALQYARQKKVGGELLINHQWAQIILTDMYSNVNMSRLAYMESANAMAISGIFKLLFIKPVYHYLKIMPKWFFKIFVSPFLKLKIASDFLRLIYFHRFTNEERNATSGWASLCKCSCSDIGLMNTNLALDLMGADGIRHDSGAEKCFRDVKLQQIYESTNQINRMNLFYCLVANTGKIPEVEYFK